MRNIVQIISFLLIFQLSIKAQSPILSGKVSANGIPLPGVTLYISELQKGAITNIEGEYKISELPSGTYKIKISFVGYEPLEDSIEIKNDNMLVRNFSMKEDQLELSSVVISGSRTFIKKQDAPIIINTISSRTFEITQSLSLSEGLNFSPGLRVENNCQNCGFTQLRMNGLEGSYSQILINSRAIFSSMAGVYGLEMLPANMIDRVEVSRGGGSVLYGGNAIAGTVNIITKDPIKNSFEAGINQSLINFESFDRTITLNGALVSENLDKGISFFAYNRERNPWDANDDGFSEISKLRNNTFGFNSFWNISQRSRINFSFHTIKEFRRGGNGFEREAHQSDIAEQLNHNIIGSSISFEQYSKNLKHKFSVYSSGQYIDRNSYYGAGGRILNPFDSLTEADIIALNAYGKSKDIAAVIGFQYNYEISKVFNLAAGTEYQLNEAVDKMPGYGRFISQNTGTLGTYTQLEIKPIKKLSFLLGGRFDYLSISGNYSLSGEDYTNRKKIPVFVPRISAMYSILPGLKLRASYAQGYRGPQAFDEDLHIETVGGAARFIRLDPNLKTERSNSGNISLSYDLSSAKNQLNFVLEGFYTGLNNQFILSDQTELDDGISVITKRNGSGALVKGVNLEANFAYGSSLIIQSGTTLQRAAYIEEETIWAPEAPEQLPAAITKNMLRTPNFYGYLTISYIPIKNLSLSYSGLLTGPMYLAHVIDPETEQTLIKRSKTFFEHNFKISYKIRIKNDLGFTFYSGIQNLFNSFQQDFDRGINRDAGYIYGPMRPRTVFIGLKFGLN